MMEQSGRHVGGNGTGAASAASTLLATFGVGAELGQEAVQRYAGMLGHS